MKTYYVLLTLLAVSNFSTAQDLQYNKFEAVQEQAFNRAESETRYCMHQFANTLLMQGMLDQERIVKNLTRTCGGKFRATVTAYKIPMAGATEDYLEVVAYGELLKIPGIAIHPSDIKE